MKPSRSAPYQVTPEKPDDTGASRDEAKRPQTQASDTGRTNNLTYAKKEKKVTPRRVLHLLRRVLIFATAILYLNVCIAACIDSVHVLRGKENPPMDFVPYETILMAKYAGTTTLRQSPLVKDVLHDDISPRTSGTLFLEDDMTTSFTTCTRVATLPERIYTDEFQRAAFAQVAYDTAYNITFLDPKVTELIMPVIDCTSSSITFGDLSAVRFFYLLRMIANPDDVYLVTVSLAIQEYKIRERNEFGSAGVATLTFTNDVQATQVTHYFILALGYPFLQTTFEVYELEQVTIESFWKLKCIQSDPSKTVKLVQTATRTGFIISTENEQSNIKNTIWQLSQSPLQTIAHWQWLGRPVLRDSWAWIHLLHFLLAIDVLVNLLVLLTVIYHNLLQRKLWIGDAFIAVSTTLYVRSSLVLISWCLNKFWAVTEFSMYTGNVISETQSFFIYPSIMRADLLAIYFCFISVIGWVLKERIDPALAIGTFYLGFEKRIEITKFFPAFVNILTKHVQADYNLGMSEVDPEMAVISPLRLWSAHTLVDKKASFILASLVPIFSTCILVIAYVVLRKIYWRIYPDKLLVQHVTGFSENEERLFQLKGNLTVFEVATGAALQNRYGIVADYDNCIYIKGIKFASADGIYSSGYVIVNGKFLVQTNDLVTILLMKLIRKRFRNIYVYDVEGTTVKQQARLVYPETMSFRDLVNLNIGILS